MATIGQFVGIGFSLIFALLPVVLIIIIVKTAMSHHVSPKSAFLHLFMIAMLYATVIAVITLLFQYVNLLFPDRLVDFPYLRTQWFSSISWASAVLIVAYPLHVYVSYVLESGFRHHPADRDVIERKWLLYLTQFITALTVIISLMSLIYRFYNGDLTTRVGLKILVVLVVAGVTLGYYRWDLMRDSNKSQIPMVTAVAVGVLVLAALIGGFFIGASPANQRALKFDDRRVTDLQGIQSEVISHWSNKKALPKDTEALKNSISGYTAQRDPKTDAAYEYNVKGDLVFELCATFETKSFNFDKEKESGHVNVSEKTAAADLSVSSYPGDPYGKNWLHESGRFCFERTIDPDLYKTPETSVK